MSDLEGKTEFKTYITNETKIYKPKPKKLCNSYNPNIYITKKHIQKNNALTPVLNYNFNFDFNDELIMTQNNKKQNKCLNKFPKLQIEKISLKEIEEDFVKLRQRKEAKKEQKELLYLLQIPKKAHSQNDNFEDKIKVKRPKNPLFEVFE